jgi:hypothetical protein
MEYQGTFTRRDVRKWCRLWALLGWAVRLQREHNRYHVWITWRKP